MGVAHYKRALLFNSHYADAMYNLGVAYGEMLKFDAAIVMYELALHFNAQCAEAWNNLGVIYKDRDNLDKAVECYQVRSWAVAYRLWFTGCSLQLVH